MKWLAGTFKKKEKNVAEKTVRCKKGDYREFIHTYSSINCGVK